MPCVDERSLGEKGERKVDLKDGDRLAEGEGVELRKATSMGLWSERSCLKRGRS